MGNREGSGMKRKVEIPGILILPYFSAAAGKEGKYTIVYKETE